VPGHRHELTHRQVADRVPQLDDLSDTLVAQGKRAGEGRLAPQNHLVQIARRRGHRTHESIIGGLDARVRNLAPLQPAG
jgi:hypothetical protein